MCGHECCYNFVKEQLRFYNIFLMWEMWRANNLRAKYKWWEERRCLLRRGCFRIMEMEEIIVRREDEVWCAYVHVFHNDCVNYVFPSYINRFLKLLFISVVSMPLSAYRNCFRNSIFLSILLCNLLKKYFMLPSMGRHHLFVSYFFKDFQCTGLHLLSGK